MLLGSPLSFLGVPSLLLPERSPFRNSVYKILLVIKLCSCGNQSSMEIAHRATINRTPCDTIVYDSLVHASTHEGINKSLALDKFEFPHNDVEGFHKVLLEVLESSRLVRQGKRSILVAVESIYSMDGDVCPLQELVDVAKEVSNGHGNIQFVVDEAHSIGVIGPKIAGLVCELGLQKDIAIVVHSFGKAIGATGG